MTEEVERNTYIGTSDFVDLAKKKSTNTNRILNGPCLVRDYAAKRTRHVVDGIRPEQENEQCSEYMRTIIIYASI